eukprot:m51a1_g11275 hypothetical protein (331) ;mRNA; r:5626-6618
MDSLSSDLASSAASGATDPVVRDWYMQVFHYYPSDTLSIIAFSAYFAIAVPLLVAAVRSRNWVIYVLPLTAVAEAVGFVFRLAVAHKPDLKLYIGYDLLVLLAPNALALVNYKVLGQIVRLERVDETPGDKGRTTQRPRVRVPLLMDRDGWVLGGRLAVVFFISDIFCFFLQMSGGGLQASGSKSGMTNGGYIVEVGLAAQLLFFGLFTCMGIYVFRSRRYKRSECPDTWASCPESPRPRMTPLGRRNVFVCLFLTIALLYVRNIYRFVQYVQGFDGYLASHEPYIFVFDTVVIFLAFVSYTAWQFVEMFIPGHHLIKVPSQDIMQPLSS